MSLYDKSARELFRDMVKDLEVSVERSISREEVHEWFQNHYPKFSSRTIDAHLLQMSINARSRVHHHVGPKHDLLFQVDRTHFRLYDPGRDPKPIYPVKQPAGHSGNETHDKGERAPSSDGKRAYYLNLFSPETYRVFAESDQTVTGFPKGRERAAHRVRAGDRLVCYLTKHCQWVGLLEVVDGPYFDSTPLFQEEDDPYVVRFHVRTLIWLPEERAVPIHEDQLWNSLSFTREHRKGSSGWTGKIRTSLGQLTEADGKLLEGRMFLRGESKVEPITHDGDDQISPEMKPRVYRHGKGRFVAVPDEDQSVKQRRSKLEVRESVHIQALLARIGARMGYEIWIPRNDRSAVIATGEVTPTDLPDQLPLRYNEAAMDTVEWIDVIWIRRNAIVRAFEVEHTTAIYSGLLRMADLLALQPGINIKLHIVAPVSRRAKVMQEILRPVFVSLEPQPLSKSCTYLSYDAVRHIAEQPDELALHLKPSFLDTRAEQAEDWDQVPK